MPPKVGGTTGVTPTTPVSGTGTAAKVFGCRGFQNDALLRGIAAGTAPAIAKGAPKGDSIKLAQTALFSLGYLSKRAGLDGAFGPGTETAIKSFQAKAKLSQTGKLDAATLKALDSAAAAQIAELQKKSPPLGSLRGNYEIVADISNPAMTRLYVMGANGKVISRYLTSPGRAEFPTVGDRFTIPDVLVRQPWNPPKSAWAANAQPIPPGIDNPMGIMKMSLGAYSEFIHGIPPCEEPELGRAASHGCLRMSGCNVLELHEKYAEAGTRVTINRDPKKSAELQMKYEDAHIIDRPTDAGREYLFGYASGELGQGQHYTAPVA